MSDGTESNAAVVHHSLELFDLNSPTLVGAQLGLFPEMPYRFHYAVHGAVQGVWFRRFTKQKADELGIVGWVKNDVGGSVSGVAIGTSNSALDQFKRAINRGPPAAIVERVDITDEDQTDDIEFTSFEIRRSS